MTVASPDHAPPLAVALPLLRLLLQPTDIRESAHGFLAEAARRTRILNWECELAEGIPTLAPGVGEEAELGVGEPLHARAPQGPLVLGADRGELRGAQGNRAVDIPLHPSTVRATIIVQTQGTLLDNHHGE